MDPKACLIRADQAVSDGDYNSALEACLDYRIWRRSGGFEPAETAEFPVCQGGDDFYRQIMRRLGDKVRQIAVCCDQFERVS